MEPRWPLTRRPGVRRALASPLSRLTIEGLLLVVGSAVSLVVLDALPVPLGGAIGPLLYLGLPIVLICVSVHAGVLSFRAVRSVMPKAWPPVTVLAAGMASVMGGLLAYLVLLESSVRVGEVVS